MLCLSLRTPGVVISLLWGIVGFLFGLWVVEVGSTSISGD